MPAPAPQTHDSVPGRDPGPTGRVATTGRTAGLVYGAALTLWAASWNLRLSVLMTWMPVEPVWIASGVLALCVVHRLGRPLVVEVGTLVPVVVLVVAFLPGALTSGSLGYGPAKVGLLVFVILPVFLASLVLLDSPAARNGWLASQVALGTAVALATIVTNAGRQADRFTLTSVDSISTARPVGAAVVVLLLLAVSSAWRWVWAVPLVALSGVVLVEVGSRGPVLYAVVAVVAVVVFSRSFRGRRVLPLVVAVAGAVLAYAYASSKGGSGGLRIVDSINGGFSDDARQSLLSSAVQLGFSHPLGVGWGEFGRVSSVGQELVNAQGVAYPHNVFAEAFAEGGFLAVIALVAVTVVALVRLWRASELLGGAVLLGVALYWILNAQVSSDFVGNRSMWVSLACGLAVLRGPGRDAAVGAPGDHTAGRVTVHDGRCGRKPGENVAGSPRRTTRIG